MNWTMEGFFAKGGTTYFVDRLAASLGIHASNIKIVSVYQGSVVVQFQIFNNTAFPLPKGGLSGIDALLKKIITKVDLGAPILGFDIKTTSSNLVTNPLNQTTFDPFPTTLPSQDVPTLPTRPANQTTSTPVVVVVPITIIQEKEQLVKDSSQVMVIVAACVVCAIVLLGGLAYALYRLKSNRHPEEADSGDLGDQNHQSKRQLQAESQLSSDANQQFDVDFEKQYHPDPSDIISKLMKNGRHQTKTSSYSEKRAKIQAEDNTKIAIEEDEDESDSSPDKRSRDNVGSFEVEGVGLSATQDHGILAEMFTKINENKTKDDTPLKDAQVQQPPVSSIESPLAELVLKPRRLPTIKMSPNVKTPNKESPNK